MTKEFNEDGLSFSYPDDWQIEREPNSDGWTVTLQSPGYAVAVIRLDRTMTPVDEVVATTLRELKELYPKLEAQSAVEMLAGEMAVGHEIEFIDLDFNIVCWTRSFYGAAGTVLVICQVSDDELDTYEPALRAICGSMQTESE